MVTEKLRGDGVEELEKKEPPPPPSEGGNGGGGGGDGASGNKSTIFGSAGFGKSSFVTADSKEFTARDNGCCGSIGRVGNNVFDGNNCGIGGGCGCCPCGPARFSNTFCCGNYSAVRGDGCHCCPCGPPGDPRDDGKVRVQVNPFGNISVPAPMRQEAEYEVIQCTCHTRKKQQRHNNHSLSRRTWE
ncbi:hypothetical protein AUEXF2481DRAFT_570895 [Aureobasidium subglaciale EXF-2481]|uniref:Uncharacterized protein n=1 Tax=Aureobasidium subglaciale (strain EXF-2481) TaxID=1043005 RepID=A0A074XXT4_AURSE|nr:uncharacterized protein AUEXF2481DRAFT_570895 [Aureobasidium subglaciale EXF-2481]KEQ90388.1 hypothetical protein AUEXF2481DRAFT_570895 [Aureobasidium subglaciale EXF-2481]